MIANNRIIKIPVFFDICPEAIALIFFLRGFSLSDSASKKLFIEKVNDVKHNTLIINTKKGIKLLLKDKTVIPKIKPTKDIKVHPITSFILINSLRNSETFDFSLLIFLAILGTK